MAEGLYRIGDSVYMEVYPPPTPYQICKIEELRKNSKGGVEVAVKCFYRRRDLPTHLLSLADQHALALEEENLEEGFPRASFVEELDELELHLAKHRELFLSRQIETFKIDMVRGKCTVHLLNELDHLKDYLKREDFFFYTMVYDPNLRNLMVDKGEIRVGDEYQAAIPALLGPEERDKEGSGEVETQVWEPWKLGDQKVEQYLVVARSVGTFARALLDGSRKPQISLRLGAAAASRDITLFHAMDTLHKNKYDVAASVASMVPRGPVLCADELEAWTQEEAKRFEEGLQDFKDFYYIQKKHIPWKPVKSIVSYYYFWKTTDRYQIQKRHRMIEKQNDLKEVIVHLRSNGPPTAPRDLSGTAASSGEIPRSVFKGFSMAGPPAAPDGKGCESCFSVSAQRWYSWGPAQEQCRLCNFCMVYWRKYGGLKLPTKWEISDKTCSFAAVLTRSDSKQEILPKASVSGRQHPYKSRKKPTVQPPSAFVMLPHGGTHWMRKKLGKSVLRTQARSTAFSLAIADSDIPSVHEAEAASRKKPVRCGQVKIVKGKLEGAVVQMRAQPSPSPMKSLIKNPPPISPIPVSLRKPQLFHSSPSQQQQPLSLVKPNNNRAAEKMDTGGQPPNLLRKRKADGFGESPVVKARRNATVPGAESPQNDYFFQADDDLRKARIKVGRDTLLKAARSPVKTVLQDEKASEPRP